MNDCPGKLLNSVFICNMGIVIFTVLTTQTEDDKEAMRPIHTLGWLSSGLKAGGRQGREDQRQEKSRVAEWRPSRRGILLCSGHGPAVLSGVRRAAGGSATLGREMCFAPCPD